MTSFIPAAIILWRNKKAEHIHHDHDPLFGVLEIFIANFNYGCLHLCLCINIDYKFFFFTITSITINTRIQRSCEESVIGKNKQKEFLAYGKNSAF